MRVQLTYSPVGNYRVLADKLSRRPRIVPSEKAEVFLCHTRTKTKKKESKARYEAKRSGRTRNFATVVYPESAPEDWINKLEELHVSVLVSPLHDKDINPSGEPKKPHYHVLLMFESPKDFETQIQPIFDSIGAVGRELVNSARGYARYLCHLDNPEKAQYSPVEVRQMGGADYYGITQLPTDDVRLISEIMDFIEANEIFSFFEFLSVCRTHRPEWFSLATLTRGWIIKEIIKSYAWKKKLDISMRTKEKKSTRRLGRF